MEAQDGHLMILSKWEFRIPKESFSLKEISNGEKPPALNKMFTENDGLAIIIGGCILSTD